MKRKLNLEIQKLSLLGNEARRVEYVKLYEDQLNALSAGSILTSKYTIDRTWQEASKLVAYMDKIGDRIQRYGLNYPIYGAPLSKQMLYEKEKNLTNYFVDEMRKAPGGGSASSEE
mmetsp:Transcript_25876/g.22807  ORF Transcript_25876/g.22807 Transcript_25876/m.22807 type:complete len:116 (+) Transcript_25876:273-620(+)|eukprot:CAMPEP_0114590134 /NCGR_PEP_ID=MMETSP0125-20121206/12435_1 /TAXON_ID=485358 ORGANISM="Aristerostoma sp., Strain ATCC 50986" /NCGR_SAMPLE_ID=MMETSP0125 /ASSEMBLY_ACC=CAM_ASM_000245 /LENGTH=115 /DNA_ID=CAMNT_0001787423 /DNA_START=233 /DNA_END=580 /DNA_ORIENTATION=+